jgi:hypothetical protein
MPEHTLPCLRRGFNLHRSGVGFEVSLVLHPARKRPQHVGRARSQDLVVKVQRARIKLPRRRRALQQHVVRKRADTGEHRGESKTECGRFARPAFGSLAAGRHSRRRRRRRRRRRSGRRFTFLLPAIRHTVVRAPRIERRSRGTRRRTHRCMLRHRRARAGLAAPLRLAARLGRSRRGRHGLLLILVFLGARVLKKQHAWQQQHTPRTWAAPPPNHRSRQGWGPG